MKSLVCCLLFSALFVSARSTEPDAATKAERPPQSIDFKGDSVSLTMVLVHDRPAIQARINGKGPFTLAIETGGSVSSVSQKVADSLHLPVSGKVELSPTRSVGVAEIDSITAEGLSLRGLTVLVGAASDPDIDGFIGLNCFEHYLVTVDYPKRIVRWERGSLPAVDNAEILAIRKNETGQIVTDITIGELTIPAAIDTRGGFVLGIPADIGAKLRFTGESRQVQGSGPSVGAHTSSVQRLDGEVLIGGYTLEQPPVAVSRLPFAILGNPLLREFALTVDLANSRCALRRNQKSISFGRPAVQTANENAGAASGLAEYVGNYGDRNFSLENGALYIQRPGGPRLKMVSTEKDHFSLEAISAARFVFERDASGKIISVRVLNREGQWERSTRN